MRILFLFIPVTRGQLNGRQREIPGTSMKPSHTLPTLALGIALLAGCRSAPESTRIPAIVFARGEVGERSYHLQPASGEQPPQPLAVPRSTGNLQTAPRAAVMAATVGGGIPGIATLQLLPVGAITSGAPILATEWAWDFALHDAGGAIAWVAGREERQLFVARAPAWKPVAVALPAGISPGEPRWLDDRRLLLVLRQAGHSELVQLTPESGELHLVYRATDDATLADACRVPESEDVLVVETPAAAGPGRLLRVTSAGGEPRVLATGFFLPGSVVVSRDGRFLAAVWSESLASVQKHEAALRWIGDAWRGARAAIPGVTSLAWSPDGAQLAVARQRDGRRWIEVYADGAVESPPRRIGFEDAACFAPQWWQPGR